MQPLFEICRNLIWYSPIFASTVKDQLSSLDTYLKIKAPFDEHLFGLGLNRTCTLINKNNNSNNNKKCQASTFLKNCLKKVPQIPFIQISAQF